MEPMGWQIPSQTPKNNKAPNCVGCHKGGLITAVPLLVEDRRIAAVQAVEADSHPISMDSQWGSSMIDFR